MGCKHNTNKDNTQKSGEGGGLDTRLGIKEECLLSGIPTPLKSGSRFLFIPTGLPWLPSTHIPQPSFTPVHTGILQLRREQIHTDTRTKTHGLTIQADLQLNVKPTFKLQNSPSFAHKL